MTAAGVCQTNDAIGHVPIAQEFRTPGIATYNVPAIARDAESAVNADSEADDFIVGVRNLYAVPAVPVDALAAKPITLHKAVSADSIGVKVDPVALFSGQIRVLLRDEHHTPLVAGVNPGELNAAAEGWRATILFVHKA